LKATKLKNEGSATSSDELKKGSEYDVTTFRFYQILSRKSGLFGSRDTISLRKDYNKKRKWKRKKSNQLSVTKANLDALLETDFLRSDKLDFIKTKAV
jgi:hypothetical protein